MPVRVGSMFGTFGGLLDVPYVTTRGLATPLNGVLYGLRRLVTSTAAP